MNDDYVKFPSSSDEWETQFRGFIKNYEFPCVGAWDGFRIYAFSKIKSYVSFSSRKGIPYQVWDLLVTTNYFYMLLQWLQVLPMMQQEVLKFNDICVKWSSLRTDLETKLFKLRKSKF